jgi:hypothetical protein
MTLAFRLSTVGKGVCVDVSVPNGDDMGAGVAETVSAAGMRVDVEAGAGEGEAGASPRPQAEMVNIKIKR